MGSRSVGQQRLGSLRLPRGRSSCANRRNNIKSQASFREPLNSCRTKGLPYPQVDWSRYQLQILFVDAEDMGGARIAHGMFEQIASWNGYSRALNPWTCGTRVPKNPDLSRTVSMMSQAETLGFSSRIFARTPEQLEPKDLYLYDMLIAIDAATRSEIVSLIQPALEGDWDDEADRQFYTQRICVLGDFIKYASKAQLAHIGGSALLPQKMSRLLLADLDRRVALTEVPTASLNDVEEWNEMVLAILLGAAGLAQYAMDSHPDDLNEFWLE